VGKVVLGGAPKSQNNVNKELSTRAKTIKGLKIPIRALDHRNRDKIHKAERKWPCGVCRRESPTKRGFTEGANDYRILDKTTKGGGWNVDSFFPMKIIHKVEGLRKPKTSLPVTGKYGGTILIAFQFWQVKVTNSKDKGGLYFQLL